MNEEDLALINLALTIAREKLTGKKDVFLKAQFLKLQERLIKIKPINN